MSTAANRFLRLGRPLLAAFVAASCKKQVSAPDPAAVLTLALSQARAATAERDTLLNDVLETTRFINAVNDDLATVRSLKPGRPIVIPGESGRIPVATYRASLLGKIQELANRVNESEVRLKESRTRAQDRGADPQLLAQLATYEKTLDEFKATIERQRLEIASLAAQVKSLRADNDRLAAEQAAATESLTTVLEDQNTAYYIAGTREQLLELGVIVQTGGGGRFLGIGKRPKMYAPGRELHPSDFTAISKLQDLEIRLPRPDRSYRIISSQNTAYLAASPDREGRIRGQLRITDSELFWAASRFLILLEER